MTGKAVGRRAGGHPDPVPGLANPDAPALTPNRTASMEGEVWGQTSRLRGGNESSRKARKIERESARL